MPALRVACNASIEALREGPRTLLILLVRAYRLLLSPWLGGGCLWIPTCPAKSLEPLERHGAAAGSYLTVRRILRCRPWCCAGEDPVPHDPPRLFTGLARPRPIRGRNRHALF